MNNYTNKLFKQLKDNLIKQEWDSFFLRNASKRLWTSPHIINEIVFIFYELMMQPHLRFVYQNDDGLDFYQTPIITILQRLHMIKFINSRVCIATSLGKQYLKFTFPRTYQNCVSKPKFKYDKALKAYQNQEHHYQSQQDQIRNRIHNIYIPQFSGWHKLGLALLGFSTLGIFGFFMISMMLEMFISLGIATAITLGFLLNSIMNYVIHKPDIRRLKNQLRESKAKANQIKQPQEHAIFKRARRNYNDKLANKYDHLHVGLYSTDNNIERRDNFRFVGETYDDYFDCYRFDSRSFWCFCDDQNNSGRSSKPMFIYFLIKSGAYKQKANRYNAYKSIIDRTLYPDFIFGSITADDIDLEREFDPNSLIL